LGNEAKGLDGGLCSQDKNPPAAMGKVGRGFKKYCMSK